MINKSLLALSNIILRLSSQDKIASYRESKLTRVLQPVLSENSMTMVVCTVNPERSHLHESISTLRFGMCAGSVKTKIKEQVMERELTPLKVNEQEFEDAKE